MNLDYAKILIKAGNGGNGIVSFHREKFVQNGGPDGGDGGNGGNIVFVATNDLNNLYDFNFKKHFKAENGANGEKKNCNGKQGNDLIIKVPKGTIIKNAENNEVIADMFEVDKPVVILKGGIGGKGNARYATATRQAPRFSQTGEITKEYYVILELKTIADVGLVGYPNAGKSTLLSVISNARPKIGDYAFTTLYPNIGIVKYYENSFAVADIPGLIEGASEGVGLGHEFLKHIERVRLIVHLIDIAETDGRNSYDDYIKINEELKKYSEKLYSLKQIVVLNKCDIINFDEDIIQDFVSKLPKDIKVLKISAVTKQGVDDLIKTIYEELKNIPKLEPIVTEVKEIDIKDKTSINVDRVEDGVYQVSGGRINEMIRGIVLSDTQSFAYFQKRLKDDGIIDLLRQKGAVDGDTVIIKDMEFTIE